MKIILLALLMFPSIILAQLEGDQFYSHKSAGIKKLDIKDYSGAIVDFTKYINLSSPVKYKYAFLETYHLRAHCKTMLEDYRGAISDYEKIIMLCQQLDFMKNDVYASAFYYMGICKNIIDLRSEGCLDLSKSGELGYARAYEAIKLYCSY